MVKAETVRTTECTVEVDESVFLSLSKVLMSQVVRLSMIPGMYGMAWERNTSRLNSS